MQHTKLQTFFLALMGIIPIFAETTNQRDSHFRQSSDIQPLSKVYSFAEDSPVDIQLPGFSITADSGSLKHSLDIVVTKLPHKAGVAMLSNMDNVSGVEDGIQLLPNGVHFSDSAPALISLAYDPARIPMGYKPKDVYTYYCDDARTWHRLVRVSIDTTLHIVTSYTTHFTDFANAVIKVPEMPESKAFVPTDMQDLPDPDPLTGIPMIAVPQANNMGTAELTYPVQLPPGRHGLQPDLDLHYNSAGGNGLLGVGWSIAQPAVTIDTRWGVPRYDLRYETEAYLINGEPFMMHDEDDIPIPLPHMASSFVPRGTRATRFYARDRRNQAKAVRHGQAPDRYWWSVTTTDGVTYYYGYDPYALTIDESSVLRTDSGNIGYWALTYVVDRFDNYIRYVNNKYSGNEIVIQRIEYTGNYLQGLSPFYSIGFSYKLRPDEQLDARLGLLRNQKHVLCQIYVQIGSNYTPITSYRLYYEEGAFSLYKSRLSSIAKVDGGFLYLNECDIPIQEAQLILSDEGWIDEENSFFNNITHEEARTEQKPACLTQFAYADACASTELYKPAETLIPSTANFSASRTEGWNIGGTAAIGVGFNPSMTTFSAGANYSYSRSQGGVETMMIDLNGDGLLDRLHVSNTLVYYERQRNSGSFASPVLIQGLDRLSREVSSSHNFGLQLDFAANLSYSPVISDSYTDVYFTDINGDGLPDLVTPEGVRINYLDSNNIPTFSPIADTVEGIEVQGNACSKSITFDGEVDERLMCTIDYVCVDTLHLPDLLPSDDGEAEFVEHPMTPDTPEDEGSGSLLPVSWDPLPIQEGRAASEHAVRVDSALLTDYLEKYKDSLAYVQPIRSSSKPAFPTTWLEILGSFYQGEDYSFRLVHDKILVFRREFNCIKSADEPNTDVVRTWVSDSEGIVSLRSVASLIPDTTFSRIQARNADGVRLRIQWNKHVCQQGNRLVADTALVLYDKVIGANNYSPDSTAYNITVEPGDIFFFRLSALDNRRFDNLNWEQTICAVSGDTLYNSARDYLCSGNRSVIAPAAGTARVTLSCSNESAVPVLITAQCANTQILNRTLSAHSSLDTMFFATVADSSHISFFVDSLSAEPAWSKVHILPSVDYWGNLIVDTAGTGTTLHDTLHYSPDVCLHHSSLYPLDTCLHRRLFGPLYRGWGWFAYNDVNHDSIIPIHTLRNEEYLMADSAYIYRDEYRNDNAYAALHNPALSDSARLAKADSCFSAVPVYNPLSEDKRWVAMHTDYAHNRYVAYGNTGAIGQRLHSVSRQIEDVRDTSIIRENIEEYDSPIPALHGNMERITTIRKSSRTVQHSLSFGLSTPIGIGVSENVSFGAYDVTSDYMDLNGDGFPDFIGQQAVQYSNPWGGIGVLEGQLPVSFSNTNSSGGFGFSASRPRPEHIPANGVSNSKMAFGGFGGGLNGQIGTDETHTSYMDINADGLPDMVDADHQKVKYNLGYSFTSEWYDLPSLSIASSSHQDASVSLSGNACFEQIWEVIDKVSGKTDYSLAQYSISGGFSSSTSQNKSNVRLIDINGDGYPDLLTDDGAGNVRVRYYDGTSFGTPQPLNVQYSQTSSTANIGFNLGVTAGIDLALIPIKFCFGVQTSPWNVSSSYSNTDFMDVNGDGYLDQVIAGTNSINVRYNKNGTRPVNLLTSVINPTGHTIAIDYSLSQPSVNHRVRTWNMTCVEDSVTPSLDASAHHRYEFTYANPFYDNFEKTDYGYANVSTFDQHTYTLAEEYENRYYISRGEKTGDLLTNESDSPIIGHRLELSYHNGTYSWSSDVCNDPMLYLGRERFYTDYYETESTAQITTLSEKWYDVLHNLISYNDYGDMAIPGDKWHQTISYKPTTSYNMIALPVEECVKDGADNTLRRYRVKYNSYGQPYQIIQDDSHQNISAITALQYDVYGNLSWLRAPKNEKDEWAWRSFIYDIPTETYVTEVFNQFSEKSIFDYDLRFGLRSYFQDPAGNEMFWRYDRMGRLIDIVAPNEAYNNSTRFSVHYIYRQPFHDFSPYAQQNLYYPHITKVVADTALASVDVTIYDARGQAHQRKSWRYVNGYYKWVTDGWRARDPWYRPCRTFDPFVTNIVSRPLWEPDTISAQPYVTLYNYDALNRITYCKHPDLTETHTAYHFANDTNSQKRLMTSYTDENGIIRRHLSSPQGWTIETYNTTDYNRTQYAYNPIGELTSVVDADGYQTAYSYDMFGNRITRIHPDAGTTEWRYAPNGSLVSKKTARMSGAGDSIHYAYCFDKLMDISYPRSFLNDVHYQYDWAGRVAYYEDGTGSTRLYYDRMGNVKLSHRRIVLPTDRMVYTFRTQFDYDSFGRIHKIVYPDNENVFYTYYQSGELRSVLRSPTYGNTVPVVDSLGYDEQMRNTDRRYGNGIGTTYHYSQDRNRLIAIKSGSLYCALLNINYIYDGVGNITRIGQIENDYNTLGGPYDYTYSCDAQNRLTSAMSLSGNFPYQFSATYSPAGRMGTNACLHTGSAHIWVDATYGYDNTRHTHQPRVVYDDYENWHVQMYWDANGNLSQLWDCRQEIARYHDWDDENLLRMVVGNMRAGYYGYDANGERVFKLVGISDFTTMGEEKAVADVNIDDATLYPNPYVTVTSNGYTKHYYANDERLASVPGGGGWCNMSQDAISSPATQHESYLMVNWEKTYMEVTNPFDYPKEPASPLTDNVDINNIDYPDLQYGCALRKLQSLTLEYNQDILLQSMMDNCEIHSAEQDIYYTHSDHLGSANWITDKNGQPIQYLHYLPYGQLYANQQATGSTYDERYKFTGKERDEESGYDYFGARYYIPPLLHWSSVDPLVDKYLWISPYAYCHWNPVKYKDPDGRWVQIVVGAAISAASDYAFQVGMNMLNGDDFSTALTHDISLGSIAFSAAAGAVGVGLAKNVNKAQQAIKFVNNAQKAAKQGQKVKGIGTYIKPNGGNAKPHGGPKHNSAIDKYIEDMPPKAKNIRKNQTQVDINGNKVGSNRPDVQYDLNGQHYNVEFDTHPENGLKHQQTIQANDPNAKVILRTVE